MMCFKFTIVAALTLQIASAAKPKSREDRPIHRLAQEIADAAQTPHRRRLITPLRRRLPAGLFKAIGKVFGKSKAKKEAAAAARKAEIQRHVDLVSQREAVVTYLRDTGRKVNKTAVVRRIRYDNNKLLLADGAELLAIDVQPVFGTCGKQLFVDLTPNKRATGDDLTAGSVVKRSYGGEHRFQDYIVSVKRSREHKKYDVFKYHHDGEEETREEVRYNDVLTLPDFLTVNGQVKQLYVKLDDQRNHGHNTTDQSQNTHVRRAPRSRARRTKNHE